MQGNPAQKYLRLLPIGLLFTFVIFLLVPFQSAHAAGVVSSCTETALNAALSGGGLVSFDCDGTIVTTSVKYISSDTVIDATGHNVILDGNATRNLFAINPGVSLTIRTLTIQNGRAGTGGAISMSNGGTLVIEDSVFIDNVSTSGNGGAIYADVTPGGDQAIVQISSSRFLNNWAANAGGAIFIDGGQSGVTVGALLEIEDSTLIGNGTLGNGSGGAIYANYHVTINSEGSLYANNQAQGDGGAIAVILNDGITNLSNNTFSGNSANQDGSGGTGGALYLKNASLVHNTFYGNNIAVGGTQRGSAIYWVPASLSVTMRDNIFSGNSGTIYECMQNNTYAPYGNNNLTDDGSCNGGTTSNPVTFFSSLLQDNGGPTNTHALLSGSNAIDSSSNCTYVSSGTNNLFSNCSAITRDQRGAARPHNTICDKGASEYRESLSWGTCGGSDLSGSNDFTFSSGRTVTVEINSANGLSCITVEEMGRQHLQSNPGTELTNNWWFISGNITSGFDVNLTLPATFVPDAGDMVCRASGSSWDCSVDDFDADSITRYNVTEFSDWATWEDQSPTALSLMSFQAKTSYPMVNIVVISIILVGSLIAMRSKKIEFYKSSNQPKPDDL